MDAGIEMILKKTIISLFIVCFLNGCIQNATFLGPAVTVVSTGSVSQAGLSYGTSKAVKKISGKTPLENITTLLQKNKDKDKEDENKNVTDFFNVVNKISKKSGIKNLANQ